jgi:mono/diheme cytochrome c family protein
MIQNALSWVRSGLGLFLTAFLLIELAVIGTVVAQSRVKTRSAERVGELFRSNCARCHGADGRGQTPLGELYKTPDFTDAEWWRKHSDITSTRSLVGIVSRGKGGMPAFGKKLKRSEITQLLSYVRRFRPQE